jgi:serine/threonine protein kinase
MIPKLLAAGGYGCVFQPGIACDGSATDNYDTVTKVQAADSAALNEIQIGEIIRKLPGYERFFGVALKSCPVQASKISSEVVKQCDVIKGVPRLLLITFNYIPNVSMQQVAMASLKRREDIYVILHSYALLLRTLKSLHHAEVVHLDLKAENILYDAVYHLPVVIDFGIAIDMSALTPAGWKEAFYAFTPDYYIWPPEVQYIAYLLHVNAEPTTREVELFARVIMRSNKALDGMPDTFRDEWASALVTQYRPYVGMKANEVIEKLIVYWPTWDNFALSIMYLRFMNDWRALSSTNNEFCSLLLEIFLFGAHPNPRVRYTPDKALSEYARIFQTELSLPCLVANLEELKSEKHNTADTS